MDRIIILFAHFLKLSINILSKYSSLIEHRPSMFEGRHIDYRSSKVDTSITDLRRSTHRSSKVDTSISEGRHIVTSIFEGRHIDLRRVTHRSSKVDTSIFDLRKSTHRSSKIEGGNITPTNSSANIVHYCAPESLEETKLHTLIRTCIKRNHI